MSATERDWRRGLTRFLIGIALGALVSGAPGVIQAQVPFSACLDRQLQPIPGRIDNSMAAGAMASREDGHPVILWNQHNLSQASGAAQLFVYLHECAHHNLNHLTRGESRSVEDQADCWAYQLLIDGDMLSGSHVDQLEHDLRHWPGDINHLGGEALLASLHACVALRTNSEAWRAALTTLTAAAPTGFHDLLGPQILDAPPGTLEAQQGTPGTYDCEVVQPPAIRCMVFATRKQRAAEKRFDALAEIIEHWLPTGWTASRPADPGAALARSYIAQDGVTGTLVILGLTPNARIYFMVKASRKG